jgi:VWFA-related protein
MRALSLGFGLAILGASVALWAQQQFPTPPTPQHPIFRAGATLVAVDVYPTRDGRVVEGLTPADFEVKEDGKPQSVEFFEFLKFGTNPADSERRDPQTAEEGERLVADPHHRAFVAYFDTYHLTTDGARKMRQPAVEFLERTIGPTDYFAGMNPETPAASLVFGQRTETIAHEVDLYWPIAAQATVGNSPLSAHEEWLWACYGGRYGNVAKNEALIKELYARWRMDLVLTSLTSLTAKLATIREERTDVLLFSDGWDLRGPDASLLDSLLHIVPTIPTAGVSGGRVNPNGAVQAAGGPPDADKCDGELSRLAALDFADGFRKLRENALRRNVAFYAIEPDGMAVFDDQLTMTSGRPRTFDQGDSGLNSLRTLSVTTNGQAIVRMNDLRTPLQQLSDAVSAYYLLGYYTTNATLDGKYRTIDVKVKTQSVNVTARHGYVATRNPVVTRTVDSGSGGPSPEATALGTLAALDSEPSLLASASVGANDVALVVEVPAAKTAALSQGADVRVTVSGSAGGSPVTATGRIDPGARSALVRVPVGTAAGPWEAKIGVGDVANGLETSLSVSRPAPGLVGDPILYRATPSPRSPLWPSAGHLFSRTDRLHLEWATGGALDSHVARLLDRRGQPLALNVTLAEPPAVDRPTLVGDVSLAPLAPGDYLVELVVGRVGATERHLVAIRVDR